MYCELNPVPELSGLSALIARSGPSAATETKAQEALIVLQAAWLMSLSLSSLYNEWDTNLTFHSQQPGRSIHRH